MLPASSLAWKGVPWRRQGAEPGGPPWERMVLAQPGRDCSQHVGTRAPSTRAGLYQLRHHRRMPHAPLHGAPMPKERTDRGTRVGHHLEPIQGAGWAHQLLQELPQDLGSLGQHLGHVLGNLQGVSQEPGDPMPSGDPQAGVEGTCTPL